MPRVSKTKKLITENERLASLPKPFSEYYPYYILSQAIRRTFEDFLITERAHADTMKISYRKPVKKPVDSSAFLPRLEDATVDSFLCDHFSDFLKDLIGNSRDPVSRPEEVARKFSPFYDVADKHLFGPNGKLIGGKQIKEFWLKAKKCLQLNAQSVHTYIDFMDLLSAFCGYTSFEYFLDAEFGTDYDSSQDDVLLDLIERYPFSKVDKDVQSQPKEKKPHELVPNAIAEPIAAYFLGREDDLILITEKLQRHRTLVIQGEGGMGKTTLAAAYYHRSIYNKSYKTVAWLFCEQGVLKAMYDLAYVLGLKLQGVDESNRLLKIQYKLKEMEESFLLVLDNVGDDLSEFIVAFQGFKWNVFVTSRARMDWEGIKAFELTPLSTESAKALFKVHYQNRSGEPLESGEEFEELLDKLISAIGQNTLMIEVFSKQLRAEFSGEKDERFGLKEFLLRLEQQGLYLEESQETVRTNYAFYRRKKEVATTTEILDILYDFSKLEKKLKSLLINVALLPADNHTLPTLEELLQPENKRLLRNKLKKLYAMGWLGGDGSTQFRISPVIQGLTIKKYQETLWDEGKDLLERVSSLIRNEPDTSNFDTKWRPMAEKLAGHFAGCHAKEYTLFLENLAILLIFIGGRENHLRAALKLENALRSDLKHFGEDALAVMIRRSNLAVVLKKLGGRKNLKRALKELEKAVALGLKDLDEDLPVLATVRSNFAVILQNVGGHKNLNRAAEEQQKALDSSIRNFGEDSDNNILPRVNLASILLDINREENKAKVLTLLKASVPLTPIHFEHLALDLIPLKVRSYLELIYNDSNRE